MGQPPAEGDSCTAAAVQAAEAAARAAAQAPSAVCGTGSDAEAGAGPGASGSSSGAAARSMPAQRVAARSLVIGLGQQGAEVLSANPTPADVAGIEAAGSQGAELAAQAREQQEAEQQPEGRLVLELPGGQLKGREGQPDKVGCWAWAAARLALLCTEKRLLQGQALAAQPLGLAASSQTSRRAAGVGPGLRAAPAAHGHPCSLGR